MSHLSAWLCSATLVFGSSIAHAAALGEKIAEVAVQAKTTTTALSNVKISAKTSSLGASYSVRETVSTLRTLKEYVTADGLTFAISWSGVSAPDFSEIFGKYYSDFKQVRDSRKVRSRKVLELKTSDLVVNSISTGSEMTGIAYVPSLFPAGLVAEDLK